MGIKYLTDQGNDGCALGYSYNDLLYINATTTVAANASITFATGGTQGANNFLMSFGNAGTAVAITQTDDISLFQTNVTLTPGGTDKQFLMQRNQLTSSGISTTAYVKMRYDRLDVNAMVRTAYLWQGSFRFGASGDSQEACYGASMSCVVGNTGSALGGELYAYYAGLNGAGLGGTRTVGFQVSNSLTAIPLTACFSGGAAAYATSTALLDCGGEGDVTHGIYINMGSGTGMTNFIKFESSKAGNAAKTTAYCAGQSYASDGCIKIAVGATAYYVPFYTAGHTSGAW